MKHVRRRRALIIDQQNGLVMTFPLFIHDGTRRGAPPDAPPGILQNLVTMETFGIRGGLDDREIVVVLPQHGGRDLRAHGIGRREAENGRRCAFHCSWLS